MPSVRVHIDCPSFDERAAPWLERFRAVRAGAIEEADVAVLAADRLDRATCALEDRVRPTWPVLIVVVPERESTNVAELLAAGADDVAALDDDDARIEERIAVAVTRARRRRAVAPEDALCGLESVFTDLTEGLGEVLHVGNATQTENLYISPAGERLYGVPRETLYANPAAFLDVVHPDDRQLLFDGAAHGLATGKPYELEYRMLRPGETEERWLRVRAFPVGGRDGGPVKWVTVTADETARKRAEIAARGKHALLAGVTDALALLLRSERVAESIDAVLARIGAAADVDRVYLATHELDEDGWPVMRVSHEWHRDGVQPLRADGLLEGRRVSEESRPLFDALDRGETLSLVVDELSEATRARLADADARSLLIVPVLRDGRAIGQVGFVDCSAPRVWEADRRATLETTAAAVGEMFVRQRLEERMRESQRLESLGVLAGGVAHDFNNLLMAILGNAELALVEVPEESPAHDSVRQITLAARRAAELTQQMLAYAGKAQIRAEDLDLGALVREMANLLEVVLPRRAALRLDLARELPSIRADAGQMRQIVLNLIHNAADALEGGSGSITVRAQTEIVTHEPAGVNGQAGEPGRYVVLEVTDTGRGMTDRVLVRAFDPFFTTKDRGRGLGLAVVAGLVRAHGGVLQVESIPGRGTTVRVMLRPLREAAEVEREPEPDPLRADLTGRSLLVVDDAPMVRDTVRRLLEQKGGRVDVAEDRDAALARVRDGAPLDAVILDLTLPGRAGCDMLTELREARPDLPVVLMSGYGEEALPSRDLGRAVFLQKPFRPAGLVRAVLSVLENPEG